MNRTLERTNKRISAFLELLLEPKFLLYLLCFKNLVCKIDISTFLYFPQPPDPQPDELVEAPTDGRGTEGWAEGGQEAGNVDPEA